VVKIAEAETRSKVFHVEHRGGGRISVEKHIVSRGTVNMREFSGSKPIVPTESASTYLKPASSSLFHVEHVVSEFCCGMFHVERAATLRDPIFLS